MILSLLFALAVALLLWSAVIEPRLLRLRRVAVVTPHWPPGRAPLRIAVLADPHVGAPHMTLARLRSVVDATNALGADLIVLAGDYVVEKGAVLGGRIVRPEPIAAELARLRAPHGVVAVLGNHDWNLDGEAIGRALDEVGIQVLENAIRRVDSPDGTYWVAGVADDGTRTPDVDGTLAGRTDAAPVIVVTHDPAVFREIPFGVAVTISGHTHGGQLRLPLFGAVHLPSRAPLRWALGHVRENGRDLVVSGGVGTTKLPVRFLCPPELVLITLEHG
jgi:uncharacterized protein